jgi:predicted phage terminase large subunit-like protein
MAAAIEYVLETVPLHPGQHAVVFSPARFRVVAAGRRWGKTVAALEWLFVKEGGMLDGAPVAYFAPTYKLLLEVFDQAARTVSQLGGRVNATEKRIGLPNGGVAEFWTLEDRDAGRGRRYARVVIDEAAHARYLKDAWEQAIRPTLTDLRGEAMFISTPKGHNYFYELFKFAQATEDWQAFRFPTWTNPFVPADDIKAARRALPELVFRQEYGAEFVQLTGGLCKREFVVYGTPSGNGVRRVGVDLAISQKQSADYTAIVVVEREGDVDHVVHAERGRWTFRETLERIRTVAQGAAAVAIEAVQYQAAVVEELVRTTTLPVVPVRPDRDKVTRFLPVLTRIEHGALRFSPALPSWFFEELLSFPETEHDDAVDALVYAVTAPTFAGVDLVRFY